MKIIRTAVQLVFFFLMTYEVTLTFNGLRAIYDAFLHQNFNMQFLFPKIIPVIAIIPLTILLGRFFCGWMCAFGTIGDLAYLLSGRVMKHNLKMNEKVDSVLKYVKYIVLFICVIVIWTLNNTFFSKFSPWDAFGLLPDFSTAISTFLIGLIVFLLVIIGSFFIERFFCRYLCPLGAFFVLVSKFRIVKIRKPTEKCGKCRICTNNCPMGIPLYKMDIVKSGECIDCMNCLQSCPRKNTALIINDDPLNPLIAGTLAVATMTGIHYGAQLSKSILFPNANAGVSSSQSSSTTAQNKKYVDGTYTGTANGFRPNLTVSVTVKGDKIISVIIGSNNESPEYSAEPFAVIPNEIIAAQSTNVAIVSGATYSSMGIKNAVADALSKALITNNSSIGQKTTMEITSQSSTVSSTAPASSVNPATSKISTYKDGTFSGTAMGFDGNIGVSVTLKNNKITSVIITSQVESRPRSAFTDIPAEIIATQSTNVSVVSGATYSSDGIKNAVANALSKAVIMVTTSSSNTNNTSTSSTPNTSSSASSSNNNSSTPTNTTYIDGTYSGVAMGYSGSITVSVTVINSRITSVIITSQAESRPSSALTDIPAEIIATQSTNVSIVSGATYSSNGIKNAVANALSKAVSNGSSSSVPSSSSTTSSRRHDDDD